MRLKEYIIANRLTASEFAKDCDLSVSFISLVVNGLRRPSPEVAARIEDATGGQVTRLELLYASANGSGTPSPEPVAAVEASK